MAGENISVNLDTLETEMSNLNSLLNDIETSNIQHKEVEGAGYTKQYMDVVGNSFVGVVNSLKVLVGATISMLDEVKDGYIEIDETTRDSIEEFKEEVLG